MNWVSLKLILAISAIFIVQMLYRPFTDMFLLISSDVVARPWILVTSVFLHSDFNHLFFNMFALVLFGSILEKTIGWRNFLRVFFITGVVSSLAAAMLYSAVLGASGAVFGVIGTLAVMRPKMGVWAFGVPMPMILAAFLWGIIDIAGLFAPSGTANLGHLGGLAAGIVMGIMWRKKYPDSRRKKENILNEKELDEWEKEHMR